MFTSTMTKLFTNFKTTTDTSEDYCLTGSFVLSLFKPCKLRRTEYFHNKKESDNEQFDSQNDTEKSYKDIIYNPENYFYIRGVKCCNLDIVKKMINNI